MHSADPPDLSACPRLARHAFTLVELLVVISLIVVLLGLLSPAVLSVKGGREVTAAAYSLAGELEAARTFAVSNHTYTWVGLYEQAYDHSSAPAAAAAPPYPGAGHVTIGVVYSRDGTSLDSVTTGNSNLPTASLGQVGKLVHLYGVHVKALDGPGTPNSTDPVVSSTLAGRPYQTDLSEQSHDVFVQTLISSESGDTATRPFTVQGYTFYKTIRFNPRGEASVNGTLPCTRIVEIGLQPTHGSLKNDRAPDALAIQLAGIGGGVNIYRP